MEKKNTKRFSERVMMEMIIGGNSVKMKVDMYFLNPDFSSFACFLAQ